MDVVSRWALLVEETNGAHALTLDEIRAEYGYQSDIIDAVDALVTDPKTTPCIRGKCFTLVSHFVARFAAAPPLPSQPWNAHAHSMQFWAVGDEAGCEGVAIEALARYVARGLADPRTTEEELTQLHTCMSKQPRIVGTACFQDSYDWLYGLLEHHASKESTRDAIICVARCMDRPLWPRSSRHTGGLAPLEREKRERANAQRSAYIASSIAWVKEKDRDKGPTRDRSGILRVCASVIPLCEFQEVWLLFWVDLPVSCRMGL